MIEKINALLPFFDRRFDFNTEELSSIELVGRTTQKINELIDHYNEYDDVISKKENSSNITINRKLSPTGDFSGTLAGRTIVQVLSDIKDALSLSLTIIAMVNDRESIGTIYDGGYFLDTIPPTYTIEGGLF